MRGVVLQQVGVGLQVARCVDSNEVEFILQTQFIDCTQGATTDTTETIDSDINSHGKSPCI